MIRGILACLLSLTVIVAAHSETKLKRAVLDGLTEKVWYLKGRSIERTRAQRTPTVLRVLIITNDRLEAERAFIIREGI